MTSIAVTARRWEHGWELILGEDDATQVRTLDKATQQVRDYLDTLHPETDHSEWDVEITPDLGNPRDLSVRIKNARLATAKASAAQRAAAAQSRALACTLRAEGLSVTDSAAILGVSRGRVTQLTSAQQIEKV